MGRAFSFRARTLVQTPRNCQPQPAAGRHTHRRRHTVGALAALCLLACALGAGAGASEPFRRELQRELALAARGVPALTVTPQRVSAGLQRATGEFVVRAPWWVSNTKSVNGDRGNLMMRPRAAAHATATHQRRKEDGMSSRDSAPSRGQETQTGTGSIAARLVLMLVIAALSLVALTASASAATIQGTAPASASAATTDSLTGSADAGSLTTQNVCAKPTNPGQVACLSQVLVTKSGHHPVRSHLAAAHSPDRVAVHGSANPLFSSPFGVAPAAAAATPSPEPQAGTPAWMQQLYDTAYLSQTAGGSDTVGIVDAYDDPNVEADLAVYRSTFGLPPCTTANGCFRKVNQNGQQSNYPPADGDWDMNISGTRAGASIPTATPPPSRSGSTTRRYRCSKDTPVASPAPSAAPPPTKASIPPSAKPPTSRRSGGRSPVSRVGGLCRECCMRGICKLGFGRAQL